ncbi:MAG TPA: diguanylate cyclase [Noviherbaspirillum sp.]
MLSKTVNTHLSQLDDKTRYRLRSTVIGFIDGAIGVAVLAVYAANGAVPLSLPAGLFAALVSIEAMFLILIATGISRRCTDPSLTNYQILAACGANLVILFAAPHLVPMALVNFFVAISYGSLLVTPRRFFISSGLYAVALGAMLWIVRDRLSFQIASTTDMLLLFLVIGCGTIRFVHGSAIVLDLRRQLKEKNRTLEKLASHDSLTNLWNRRTFLEFVEAEKTRCLRIDTSRTATSFSVAIIDIDHFKKVNDTFGHLIGDKVIAETARLLDQTVRTADLVARYGGEEFTVLLVNAVPEHVADAGERLRTAIERHDWSQVAPGLRVTVSIGAAPWQPGEEVNQTLHRADQALYTAKRSGRNRVHVDVPGISQHQEIDGVRKDAGSDETHSNAFVS